MKDGTLFYEDEYGHFRSCKISLPIETHSSLVMWSLDFIRAFYERPKILRWIARMSMGKYAYRELFGIKESLDKYGYVTDLDYGLQNQDYHKDKIPT